MHDEALIDDMQRQPGVSSVVCTDATHSVSRGDSDECAALARALQTLLLTAQKTGDALGLDAPAYVEVQGPELFAVCSQVDGRDVAVRTSSRLTLNGIAYRLTHRARDTAA